MKKTPREGSLLRINLPDGMAVFARVLANAQVAVYSYRTTQDNSSVSQQIYDCPVLWILTVMKSAFEPNRWRVVDFRPLEPALSKPVEYFIRDRITGEYSTYRSSDGHTRPSSSEYCKKLEAAAVWEPEQVEERIVDHFNGRPNQSAMTLNAADTSL